MSGDFKRYYEDELAFLREMGGEFGRAYPDIARELGLAGHDPDIERLLQGVAFLCGRIRQTLDSEFPELLHPLLGHVWPQALRPSPCGVVMEFKPRANMCREPELLRREALVLSQPVEGTSCQFRLAYETPVLPAEIDQVKLTVPFTGQHRLVIGMRLLPGAVPARLGRASRRNDEQGKTELVDIPLRLHLHGANVKGMGRTAFGLYAALGHSLRGIRLRVLGANAALLAERTLPAEMLRPVGWESEQSLLPYPRYSFSGYRHLVEYFLFPSKYLFYDLTWSGALSDLPAGERIELWFELDELRGEDLAPSADHVRLNCAPAINLFSHTATPFQAEGTRADYLLRPEGLAPDHYDIFSVDRVVGHVMRALRPVEYQPFFSFHLPKADVGERPVLYQVHLRPPISHRSTVREDLPAYPAVPTYLSFVDPSGQTWPIVARVSVDLLCTNRDLPLRLKPGQINKPSRDIPGSIQLSDLGAMSLPAPVPVAGAGLWRFFAYFLVGLHHFKDRDSLRLLLHLYNFPARFNRSALDKLETLLGAITSVSAQPGDRLVGRPPVVVRGMNVRLDVHETRFAHFGELLLFGSVLDHFLRDASTVNTYTQLTLCGIDHKLERRWPPRVGSQELI